MKKKISEKKLLGLHPVQTIYHHLTSMLSHVLGDPVEIADCIPCYYCKHDSDRLYSSKDQWGEHLLCAACRSFLVTDISIMGVERKTASGKPVGGKYGMFPSCGFLHEFGGKKRSFLFVLSGVIKKLPPAFYEQCLAEVIECGKSEQIEHIAQMNLSYPVLYVHDFGVRTPQLIQSLKVSHAGSALVSCTANSGDSMNRSEFVTDMIAIRKILAALLKLGKKDGTCALRVISGLATGRITPEQVSDITQDSPSIKKTLQLFPVNPHDRLSMCKILSRSAF